MKVSWNTFKTEVLARKIAPQYVENDFVYYIAAKDDWFLLECDIDKSPSDTTDLDDFENNYKDNYNKRIGAPSAKAFADKGALFFRGKGIKQTITANSTESIIYTIGYNKAKLNGIEVMFCNDGDSCNFKILDTTSGSYTTIPNYLLNQFGFDWNLCKQGIKELLPYDADVFIGMQLVVEYTNNSSEDTEIGVNFYIHEDKS